MLYNSTQNAKEVVSAAQAIAQGISKDGGLFVPQEFPKYDENTFKALLKTDYKGRAKKVFSDFLSDFTEEEISDCVEKAYTAQKFGGENPAPISYCNLDGTTLNILELWHGPTCAFKDMALQILPHLLTKSLKKKYDGKTAVILVATSGDTGKAALEGFKDVDHTKIVVFYPVDGVSPMQKHQMNTQEGENVRVCAIKGNFDDAQTGVKKIFTTPSVAEKLAENNMLFSSANSINWGRLLPQIVYYISAYCDLVNDGKIELGDKINVVVPTGNFGNILASYYASLMGLPINKFICASNENKVLYDFFRTGTYDRKREFILTTSPSMDILISSNLERLIYRLTGEDAQKCAELMQALSDGGEYTITEDMKKGLADFYGNYCSEEETNEAIHATYKSSDYVIDPHTAVAAGVYKKYLADTDDHTPTVIASTASPYKFTRSVMDAVAENTEDMDDFALADRLSEISGVKVPKAVEEIRTAPVLHDTVVDAPDMPDTVKKILGIK